MMHNWFTCKIRYEKTMENGMNKKVTEPYLVDALSFTEAESRIIEEMTPFISGEFEVSGVAKANYNELFPSEEESADRWYKCKQRTGTSFRPSRRHQEAGRRNERHSG